MKKEFVTATILVRLGEVLTSHGFSLQGEEYMRDADGIRQKVAFSLADFEPAFEVSIGFAIRVHAAEQVFTQFWRTSGETDTCSFRLSHFAPDVTEHMEIQDQRGLKSTLARLGQAVVRVAIPLLDSLQDVASIERLFNDSESKVRFQRPEPFRSMSAVILAHLMRNRERDRLMDEYRPRVVRQGKDCEASYDRLVDYLKGRALGEA